MKASKTFWWSEQGRLDGLWENLAPTLLIMWIALILASVSTFYVRSSLSLVIIGWFLFAFTFVWWIEIKETQEWLDEHYGDWDG